MNPSHSCYCTQHSRLKHRGVTCPACSVEVRFGGWGTTQYLGVRLHDIQPSLRTRVHSLFGWVSRKLDTTIS